MPSITASLAAAILATLANGQIFSLDCAPLLIERGDPILSPGLPRAESHVHTIVGGTGFNFTMSLDLAPNSPDTTCNRPFDHSNYWQPALYSQTGPNNTFQMIDFQTTSIFYFNRACDYAPGRTECPEGFKAQAPPAGMRIISGNSTFRLQDYNSSSFSAQAIQSTCLDGTSFEASYPGLPTKPCKQVRAESYFPSCWDGKNLDSADHFSHMAWPVQSYKGGVCPESHPTAIYSVLYYFYYNTEPFPEWKKWVFAMGDPTGYGLHGDFLQGWTNQTALEEAINTCTGFGGPDAAPCSVAVNKGTANSVSPIYTRTFEDVGMSGPIALLPGTHPVTGSWQDRQPALLG